jgi:hypothetical protein
MTLPTDYKTILQENICLVQFRKVDGSIRNMRCTLQEKLLPEVTSTSTNTRAANESAVAVFDLDKQAWRSFRKSDVISFETEATLAVA